MSPLSTCDQFDQDTLIPGVNRAINKMVIKLYIFFISHKMYLFFVVSSPQHFSEQMEDFSNDLFSSFFDDHLLAERNPLLDMDLDPPNPAIQAEHSYSLSGDSAPQSPSMPIKSDDDAG